MSVILRREFRSYFRSITGYIFVSVMLVFSGIFVYLYNFTYSNPSPAYALSDLMLVAAILIPIVCIRVFADERNKGTHLLLISLPLKSSEIVLGKYFALLSLVALPTAFMALTPLLLGWFGEVNYLSAYSALLCFFLFEAALTAICFFLSSLSDNISLCAIFSYIAVVALYFSDLLIRLLGGGAAAKLLSPLALFAKFSPFLYGIFDVGSLIYYLSLTALFVFFTILSFDKRSKTVGGAI